MVEESSSDPVAPASSKSHGWLRDLIDYLHRLIIAISAKLRHMQIHRSPMGEAKGDYDIWDKLGKHLQQVPVLVKHDAKPRLTPKRAEKGRKQTVVMAKNVIPTDPELNEIREYNRTKVARRQQPHISDQLQSKTMEHINIALILAAEGNRDGAKLHIDLANSAMHTASRFMNHEDYKAFEVKVETRVRSIIDRDRHADSPK